MLLHSIPREVNDDVPDWLKFVIRAYKNTFKYKGVALFIEHGKVVGAGWKYDPDFAEYRSQVIDGYTRWTEEHLNNWAQIGTREINSLPEYDSSWIDKRIYL